MLYDEYVRYQQMAEAAAAPGSIRPANEGWNREEQIIMAGLLPYHVLVAVANNEVKLDPWSTWNVGWQNACRDEIVTRDLLANNPQ